MKSAGSSPGVIPRLDPLSTLPLRTEWASILRSGTPRACGGELSPDDGRDEGAQDLDGPQHLLMRKRRDTHLERDARDAAEDFIRIEYLFRNGLGIADQEGTGGST